jgi:hypothetical protein
MSCVRAVLALLKVEIENDPNPHDCRYLAGASGSVRTKKKLPKTAG